MTFCFEITSRRFLGVFAGGFLELFGVGGVFLGWSRRLVELGVWGSLMGWTARGGFGRRGWWRFLRWGGWFADSFSEDRYGVC